MPILLAAVSAVTFGVGDFFGGLSARRMAAALSGLTAQFTGMVLLVGVAAVAGGTPSGAEWAWGVDGRGVGRLAVVLFYWAMAAGR